MDSNKFNFLTPSSVLYKPDINVFEAIPYEVVLAAVKGRVVDKLSKNVEDVSESELKGLIVRDIEHNQVKCSLTQDIMVLIEHIYHDMAGYSFISREQLFEREGFEEININGWDDVEIISHGRREKTAYRFLNPQQAEDILNKMLRKTSTSFDAVTPHATADIGNSIRITATRAPIIDAERGVTASIRKVNSAVINRAQILENQTLSPKMLTFMELSLHNGISSCISGGTGAGKTTLASSLLKEAARTLRIYTVEEGAREWDFIMRDEEGRVTNSVIHTKTRIDTANPLLNIDQETLCKLSLRYDPDIVAPSEIRGKEAFEVMSIANTGHTVCTTIHSNGTNDTPSRIVELAKKAYDMEDSTLYSMCVRAFPILLHIEKGVDHVRRVTEIREVTGYSNGQVQSQLLFDFYMEDNILEDGVKKVLGHFRQCNPISDELAQRLMKKGACRSELAPYLKVTESEDTSL